MVDIQKRLTFASHAELIQIAETTGTPVFIHDENSYREYAQQALNAPNAFGLKVRYAMKANSHKAVLKIFDSMGLHIDASSYYEVKRAMAAGISADKISLTSQEPLNAEQLKELAGMGVLYNATSLLQLKRYGECFTGSNRPLSVRINPGLGSGHNNRTNTGGPAASFGIWHQYLDKVLALAREYSLKITHVHTHVGSGSDWKIWQKAARLTLDVVREMPDVTVVNMGGGYRIDRNNPENSMDFGTVFPVVSDAFRSFADETGRKLQMEIEPGTYLAANSCILVSRICDMVDTGKDGYNFLKLDSSMTELLRPMIYGARHPIILLGKGEQAQKDYVVAGTCCESGDIFTPSEGDPERVSTVKLPEAQTGDYVAITGAGAYGITMSAKNYNSRPICAEAMIRSDGSHVLITRRQKPEEIWANEIEVEI
ncbi:MAG: diaminopimelate decarboxylase [Fibrobacter sp.]|nr:diaminopimelate decarboxylase [Fibrobacter sp.]